MSTAILSGAGESLRRDIRSTVDTSCQNPGALS
jgi:hypothetical protein